MLYLYKTCFTYMQTTVLNVQVLNQLVVVFLSVNDCGQHAKYFIFTDISRYIL